MSSRDDDSTLAGRVRRYASVSRSVGGIAVRLGAERFLGVSLDRDRHAEELKNALGGLKGPLMKVAQLLATIPDVLPDAYVAELAQLQTNAPSMGWPFVRRRMANELGPDWRKRFAAFEQEAAAAASLGQVHKATGLDGRALACKLQYPDMASTVEADLRQLKIVFAVYHRYDKAIEPAKIQTELAARLREELDYDRERRHMELYRIMLADEPGVHIPEPVPELCSRRLLTMTWLEGVKLLAVAESGDLEMRNRVAFNMFRAWYRPFYDYGVIHGDPHLGNYTVRPDGTVNLLDFGCVRIFQPKFVRGVIDLYHALDRGDRELAVHAYETWGFTSLSAEMLDTLNIWAEFIYAPLLDDRPRRIHDQEGGIYGARIATKVHQELRRLGGVSVPREFVLMDRAAIGLGSVFLHLKAEINWYELFHQVAGDFDEKVLARRQTQAMKKLGIEPPA